MTYPDPCIEYWGRVYRRAADLHGRVGFERFLARPDVYLTDERAQRLADDRSPSIPPCHRAHEAPSP